MKFYKEYVKPVVVLLAICLVVSVALGATYRVTSTVIAEREQAAADATRREFLPNATSFTKLDCSVEGINSVYKDDGGTGYVIEAATSGYGGAFTVTVGLDADGAVVAVRCGDNSETQGVGSRATEPAYLDTYKGVSGSAEQVDVLSGASLTSRGIKKAVDAAFAAYESVKGVG